MIMAEKKDPGKFTVRFNIADPQQRTVIELLNQQGRYKAQFITSAILHYVRCSETPEIRGVATVGSEEIERIVRSVLAQQQASFELQPEIKASATHCESLDDPSNDADRDVIFKTLEAFKTKQ